MPDQDSEWLLDLLMKYQRNELSEGELKLLQAWRDEPGHQEIFDRISNDEELAQKLRDTKSKIRENELQEKRVLEDVSRKVTHDFDRDENTRKTPAYRRIFTWQWAAAAAILLIAITFGYHWSGQRVSTPAEGQVIITNDIPTPTGTRSILTLADGSKIALDSVQTGTLAHQGSTNISKLMNGQISYHSSENMQAGELTFNTLSTARGGQTVLVLADGTKVWLDAASSITYPAAFTGDKREVKITGQAYFEVTKNKAKPFRVEFPDMKIEVLGTHFNVEAYDDESIVKTTLLEGSVRVLVGQGAPVVGVNAINGIMLKPGQQAQVSPANSSKKTNTIKILDGINTEGVVAWKNGHFHFENSSIRSVMRELGRWYDIDVKFVDPVTNHTFSGDIQRNLTLSQVIQILSDNIHYTIEDKKMTVKP